MAGMDSDWGAPPPTHGYLVVSLTEQARLAAEGRPYRGLETVPTWRPADIENNFEDFKAWLYSTEWDVSADAASAAQAKGYMTAAFADHELGVIFVASDDFDDETHSPVLGYDVSPLPEFYSPVKRRSAEQDARWGHAINAHGLFATREDAVAFRDAFLAEASWDDTFSVWLIAQTSL